MEDMQEYHRCLDVIGLTNHIEADPVEENDEIELINDEKPLEELITPKVQDNI